MISSSSAGPLRSLCNPETCTPFTAEQMGGCKAALDPDSPGVNAASITPELAGGFLSSRDLMITDGGAQATRALSTDRERGPHPGSSSDGLKCYLLVPVKRHARHL
jgi:hypothetical protein